MQKPLRVLMVEDSEDDALLTIRALTKGGYEPVYQRVETAEAMLTALREQTWDVLLCDYRLPQFSGSAAIALLKESGIDLPLIIVSSTIGEETAADCLRYGARDWVRKSNLSRLVPAIERELQEAESRRKKLLAEGDLRESEERYRILSEAAFEAIATHEEGVLLSANDQYFKMFGYEPGEALGKEMMSVTIAPEDRELVKKQVAINSQGPYEAIGVRKDGTRFPMEVRARKMEYKGRSVRFGAILDITERKRREDELKKSEEKYRTLVETTRDLIYITDSQGFLTYINPTLEKTLGYTKGEWNGKSFAQLVAPECIDQARDIFRKTIRGESIPVYEIDLIRKDGTRLSVAFNASTIIDNEGKPAGRHGIGRDITERKQAEEALRRSEENFRQSFDDSPLGVRIVNAEGETVYANRAILATYGFDSLDELKATPPINRYTPESYTEFRIRREKRQQGDDAPSEYTIDIIRKDGKIRHLQVFRKQIFWDGEKQFQVIYQDVTERKQAEDALQASKAQLSSALEMVHLGHWEYDVVNDLFTFNDQFYKMFRTTVEHVGGYTMQADEYAHRFVHPADINVVSEETRKAIESMDPQFNRQLEHRMLYADGTVGYINVRFFIVKDAHGRTVKTYGVNQDVTERKQAEDGLRDSENRYRVLLENIGSGVSVYETRNNGEDFIFKEYNAAAEGLDKTPREQVIGRSVVDVFPGVKDFGLLDVFRRVYRTGKAERHPVTFYKDQKISGWRENYVYKLPSGEIVAVFEDITERKQAEEKLKISHHQLRALAKRLQQIREEERLLVAREIHDEMGGGLTGLKMDLSWLLRQVGDTSPGEERAALIDKLHTANGLIDQMIREVRRISTALRPSILDDLGLIAALEWQLAEFTNRTEIPHEFSTTCEYVNLEANTAIAVFRIFQEALTNVVRHSRATKVMVDLREGERSLFGEENFVLEIRDNGRGITEEEILRPESLGLLGMKERVLAFGGEISFHDEPGGGTALVLQIPQKQGDIS